MAISDRITARMFLTRWFSSSFSIRCRMLGPRALLGHQLVVAQHDLDRRRPRRLGDIEVGLGPRLGLALDRLLPDREALARRQPVAERPGGIGLVRVAAPVQGVDELAAEEEQIVPRQLRQRHRQQPRRLGIDRPRPGMLAATARPSTRSARRDLRDEGGERRHRLGWRRLAVGAPAPVDPQADAVAGQQPGEIGQVVARAASRRRRRARRGAGNGRATAAPPWRCRRSASASGRARCSEKNWPNSSAAVRSAIDRMRGA